MKTTFKLEKPNVKLARQIESAKSTINKYIKRERKKTLPDGVDFWDFNCKFGDDQESAKVVHLTEIAECLSDAEKRELTTFYVEIEATQGVRQKKAK